MVSIFSIAGSTLLVCRVSGHIYSISFAAFIGSEISLLPIPFPSGRSVGHCTAWSSSSSCPPPPPRSSSWKDLSISHFSPSRAAAAAGHRVPLLIATLQSRSALSLPSLRLSFRSFEAPHFSCLMSRSRPLALRLPVSQCRGKRGAMRDGEWRTVRPTPKNDFGCPPDKGEGGERPFGIRAPLLSPSKGDKRVEFQIII